MLFNSRVRLFFQFQISKKMNSPSTFGLFVSLFFAYCTPTQGNFGVVRASFEDGRSFVTSSSSNREAKLFCAGWKTYGIEETEYVNKKPKVLSSVKFGMEGIDTMIGANVVLRTSENSYLQAELTSPRMCKILFTATTRPKLGDSLYSYRLSVVHLYDVNPYPTPFDSYGIKTISGYMYSTTGTPQYRYIIHLGEEFDSDLNMCLLWTEKDFNYFVFDKTSIILTLRWSPRWKYVKYYFVRFVDKSDLDKWLAEFGQFTSDDIPQAPEKVQDYFFDCNQLSNS